MSKYLYVLSILSVVIFLIAFFLVFVISYEIPGSFDSEQMVVSDCTVKQVPCKNSSIKINSEKYLVFRGWIAKNSKGWRFDYHTRKVGVMVVVDGFQIFLTGESGVIVYNSFGGMPFQFMKKGTIHDVEMFQSLLENDAL